jgi:hypothetical protein
MSKEVLHGHIVNITGTHVTFNSMGVEYGFYDPEKHCRGKAGDRLLLTVKGNVVLGVAEEPFEVTLPVQDITALARKCTDLEEQNKKLREQAQQYAQEHIVELERATAMALVLATLVKTLQDERVRALSPQIEEMCNTLIQCITTGLAAVMTEDKDAD